MNHDHDYDDGRVEQREIREEFFFQPTTKEELTDAKSGRRFRRVITFGQFSCRV